MTDLKAAVFTVLEGWALPLDARKILETAYYAQPEQSSYSDIVSDGGLDSRNKFDAQPKQESISTNDHLCAMLRQVHDVLACTALPMKRQWVGLSVEDQADILDRKWWNFEDEFDLEGFLRVTEAKLKEKNNAHT
jgi:hypothetical protein